MSRTPVFLPRSTFHLTFVVHMPRATKRLSRDIVAVSFQLSVCDAPLWLVGLTHRSVVKFKEDNSSDRRWYFFIASVFVIWVKMGLN